jgi:hypothetical protein
MAPCHFNKLPNELLAQIFTEVADFNGAPPSTVSFALEPSLLLTKSPEQPLKISSLVCHRWRKVTLPLLFQHAVVTLDGDAAWLRLCPNLSFYIKTRYRKKTPKMLAVVAKIDSLAESLNLDESDRAVADRPLGFEFMEEDDRTYPAEYFHWLPSVKGKCEEFLAFLEENDLAKVVQTLVVSTPNRVTERQSNFEDTLLFNNMKVLWRHIFKTLDLCQVIVAAPPSTMAALTGCEEDTWDDWLFQMPLHYLKFAIATLPAQHSRGSKTKLPPNQTLCRKETWLHNAKPWAHMAYNEGTSLRAYGHYEYQWKQSPRVLPSLVKWLAREIKTAHPPLVESVEYISLFPYASHVHDFVLWIALLPHLREFKVKLADPDLLDDSKLMGKAQPSDVYSEWEKCYQIISHNFLFVAKDGTVFISNDTKYPALKKQVLENFKRRSIMSLSNRLIVEEEDDVIRWRVQEAN